MNHGIALFDVIAYPCPILRQTLLLKVTHGLLTHIFETDSYVYIALYQPANYEI